MAFVMTIAQNFPGWGVPNFAGPSATVLAGGGNSATPQVTGVVANNATVTVTWNAFGGMGFIRRAWVRVKNTSVNAATTLSYKITGTDGVTTVQFIPTTPATAAGTITDMTFCFQSDLNLTSVTLSIIAGVNTSTSDCEIAACV